MTVDDRHPIIVGTGQITLRDQGWPDPAGPMDLMSEAVGAAAADCGASGNTDVLAAADHLTVINIFCWDHGNAPAMLGEAVGLDARAERRYTGPGGNSPQAAVNDLAARLADGEIEVALVAGAEALAAKQRARREGHRVDWGTHADPLPSRNDRDPSHPIERDQLAMLPIVSYPLWEPALRVSAGHTPDEHNAHIGKLMARFTDVAADNPHAWFRGRHTPDELMTITGDNRMISTPYPKLVNSIIRVDQGAALVMTTVGKARALGIPRDRWVHVLGAGDCNDLWYLSERTAYDRSPGMERVAAQVTGSSGVGSDEIDHLDLYSCFPSAVQLAMRAWGIADDDPRPPTVTGGLPYAGGPGNNYTTHSIAAMTDLLREDAGSVGLCTGLGWFVTKHSAGLYGSGEPRQPFRRIDPTDDQAAVDSQPHPVIEPEPSGTATIEAYSVFYDRQGQPEVARCIATLDDDRRTMVSSTDVAVAAAVTEGEWFGRTIQTRPDLTFTI